MIQRPMLACSLAPEVLRFPVLATPKVDGIRALVVGGRALTRSFKPVRNEHIAALLETLPEGSDGELVCGNFQSTQSAVMSYGGKPDFTFYCFDVWSEEPYAQRALQLPSAPFAVPLVPRLCEGLDELLAYEEEALRVGWEGFVCRPPGSPYLFGRATPSSQHMVKVKRMATAEARVVGFRERTENLNPPTRNAFGYVERKGSGSNRAGRGDLGGLDCVDADGSPVDVGDGFTDAERRHIWDNQPLYLGRWLEYKHQRCGAKDRPRFPVFLRWRDDLA